MCVKDNKYITKKSGKPGADRRGGGDEGRLTFPGDCTKTDCA